MREQFEKLPDIARRIHKLVFQEDLNCYRNKAKSSDIHLVTWVNGAWYLYQYLKAQRQSSKDEFITLTQEWHTKGWNARQSEIDELKAQLECCRKENAVLLGKVGELEKNEFLLARVKTILGCEKKTNLLESIIVRDLRKVLRGEHEGN